MPPQADLKAELATEQERRVRAEQAHEGCETVIVSNFDGVGSDFAEGT